MKLNRMINELRGWAEKLQDEAEANSWKQYSLAPDPLKGETRHSLTVMVKRTKEMLEKRNEDTELGIVTTWESNRELQIIKLMSDYLDARIQIVNQETGSNIKNTIKLPDPVEPKTDRSKIYMDGVELSLPLQEVNLQEADEPRPDWVPKDMPWYGKATTEDPDPYIFDGHMSVEDHERLHELLQADKEIELTAEPIDPADVKKILGNTFRGMDPDLLDALGIDSNDIENAAGCLATAGGVSLQEALGNVVAALRLFFDNIVSDVITPMADALKQIFENIPDWMKDLPPEDEAWLEAVATPRQWHLYKCGNWKKRKKWRHALERKARRKKKEVLREMANDYYKCPDCGAILDPGEKCDCKDQKHEGGENDGNTENTAGNDTRPHEGNAQQLPGKCD